MNPTLQRPIPPKNPDTQSVNFFATITAAIKDEPAQQLRDIGKPINQAKGSKGPATGAGHSP